MSVLCDSVGHDGVSQSVDAAECVAMPTQRLIRSGLTLDFASAEKKKATDEISGLFFLTNSGGRRKFVGEPFGLTVLATQLNN